MPENQMLIFFKFNLTFRIREKREKSEKLGGGNDIKVILRCVGDDDSLYQRLGWSKFIRNIETLDIFFY